MIPRGERRIILVNPRTSRPDSVRLPLSLLSLASVLGSRSHSIVDGNLTADPAAEALRRMGDAPAVVGVSVMPGPQVAPAIAVSAAIRAARPDAPIVWGGFFPTLYPDAAINAPYVDFVVRGQGEATFAELLDRIDEPSAWRDVAGLTWKDGGQIVHNPGRPIRPPDDFPELPYESLDDANAYFRPSFLGRRTGVHQAALGCRFRCRFCGVVSMFDGFTRQEPPRRLESALRRLRDGYGADAIQFYDHNFFDRESSAVPALEVLARFEMPWWCYARADALAGFPPSTWALIRRSRLRMAYIGAETASDETLRRLRKGGRVEATLECARLCKAHGVIPEFSFVVGGPEDAEREMEETFSFIRRLKRIDPACEIFLYFYSPTPQRDPDSGADAIPRLLRYGPGGPPLPATPEGWADPLWVGYVCHQDAPWLTPRLRRRVRDFVRVLHCRFPTVQDHRTSAWAKDLLRSMAGWRWKRSLYSKSWELGIAKRLAGLKSPEREGI